MKKLLFFILLLSPFTSYSLNYWRLKIEGVVLDYNTHQSISNGEILISLSNRIIRVINVGKNGEFTFDIDKEGEYLLTCTKEGFFSKKITINAKRILESKKSDINSNYKCQVDIFLFRRVMNIDSRILQEPVGEIFFIEKRNNFSYHIDEEIENRLNELGEKIQRELKKPVNSTRVHLDASSNHGFNIFKKLGENDTAEPRIYYVIQKIDRGIIKKYTIVYKNKTWEFKEIEYEWGSSYYKKNDQDLGESAYMQQLKSILSELNYK
jgi:hypothetical protein